jgi:hypothetical protein
MTIWALHCQLMQICGTGRNKVALIREALPGALHVHEGRHMHRFGDILPLWLDQKGHPRSPWGVGDLCYAHVEDPSSPQAVVYTDGVLGIARADRNCQQEHWALGWIFLCALSDFRGHQQPSGQLNFTLTIPSSLNQPQEELCSALP